MPEPGLAETPGVPQEASPAAIVMASGKAERLPTPPKEPATASAARRDARPVALAATSTPQDVVLFDACMPRCESQDPLIAANRSPSEATPPPAAVQLARYLGDTAQGGAAPRDDTGLIDAISSRIAAVGQAGLRAVAGGLTSLAPW